MGVDPEPPQAPLRILLVEDSPDNCVIILAYLQDTPYRVHIAGTGALAVKMFTSGTYDLVLMDRQMPVMDGLTATRQIRAWERENNRPPSPIIALTASALKGDREQCLAAGCTTFLTKPIRQEVLLETIREFALASGDDKGAREWTAPADVVRETAAPGVHPRLAARVPAFLYNCAEHVVTMGDALEREDFQTVEFLGHGMRGAGGMFGFDAITDIGRELQEAAEARDHAACRRWVSALADYLGVAGGRVG